MLDPAGDGDETTQLGAFAEAAVSVTDWLRPFVQVQYGSTELADVSESVLGAIVGANVRLQDTLTIKAEYDFFTGSEDNGVFDDVKDRVSHELKGAIVVGI